MEGDFEKVTERLWCMIDKTVREPSTAFVRAKAHMRHGRWTLAALYLQRAITLQPAVAEYQLALAEAYARLKRYPQSLHVLDQVERLMPDALQTQRLREVIEQLAATRVGGKPRSRGRTMTTEPTESNLRQRVQRAIISNALFDWRGGIIIAVSILLGFFGPDLLPGAQGWYFLLGGAAAWGALTFSIIKDPETGAQVAAGLLRQKFEPTTLRSPDSARSSDQSV